MTALAVVANVPVVLDEVRRALAEACSFSEVDYARRKADFLATAARKAGAAFELQNECAELRLRAERRAGELLADEIPMGRPGKESHAATLTDLGVTRSDSSRWQRIASIPEAAFDAYIAAAFLDRRDLTQSGALKLAKQASASDPEKRPALHLVGEEDGLPGLSGVFGSIVVDPPWQYDNKATRGAAADHYPTLTVAELCALDVEPHAAEASHLYLWTTNGFLRQAFDVLDAWGFTYKAHLAWVKPQMGMGNYFRISHEHVLFGVRGGLRTSRRDVRSWFEAPRGKHSAKPESFLDMVETTSPGPYLEMFARRRRMQDWTYWGNES